MRPGADSSRGGVSTVMPKITKLCYPRGLEDTRSLFAQMNVSLTRELEKIVDGKVASGRYASASEVIREALRLLEERDQFKDLREQVRLGLEQLDRGRRRPFDDRTLERIKSHGRKRLAAARRKGRSQ